MENTHKNSLERGMYNFVQPLSELINNSSLKQLNLYNRIKSRTVDVHSHTDIHSVNEDNIIKFVEKEFDKPTDFLTHFTNDIGNIVGNIETTSQNRTLNFEYKNNIKGVFENSIKNFLTGEKTRINLHTFLNNYSASLNSTILNMSRIVRKVEDCKTNKDKTIYLFSLNSYDTIKILGYEEIILKDYEIQTNMGNNTDIPIDFSTKTLSKNTLEMLYELSERMELCGDSVPTIQNGQEVLKEEYFAEFLKSLNTKDLEIIIRLTLFHTERSDVFQKISKNSPIFFLRRKKPELMELSRKVYNTRFFNSFVDIREVDSSFYTDRLIEDCIKTHTNEINKFLKFYLENSNELIYSTDLFNKYTNQYEYDYEYSISRLFMPLLYNETINNVYGEINMSYFVNRVNLLNENFSLNPSSYGSLNHTIISKNDCSKTLESRFTRYSQRIFDFVKTQRFLPSEVSNDDVSVHSFMRMLFNSINGGSAVFDNALGFVPLSLFDALTETYLVDFASPILIELEGSKEDATFPERIIKYDKGYEDIPGRIKFKDVCNDTFIVDKKGSLYASTNLDTNATNFCTITNKDIAELNSLGLKYELPPTHLQSLDIRNGINDSLAYKDSPHRVCVRNLVCSELEFHTFRDMNKLNLNSRSNTFFDSPRPSNSISVLKVVSKINNNDDFCRLLQGMETLDKDGVESYINNLEVTDSISSFLARCRKGFCVNSKYVHDYEDNIQYTRDCNYGFISQNISSCGWFNRYENSNYAELREGHYEADYCIERSYLSYPNWIEDEDGVFWSQDDYEDEFGSIPEGNNLHEDGYRYVEGYHHYRRMVDGVIRNTKTTVGIEVEKEDMNAYLKESARAVNRRTGLMKERDSSLGSWGYEIITPTFDLYRKDLRKWIEEGNIQYLYDANKSRSCGMHVHIGRVGMRGVDYFHKIKYYVPLLYAIYESRVNHSYSRGKSIDNMVNERERTQAVNILDNRIEIRCFPSPKSTKTLLWRIELLKIFDKKPLNSVNDLVRDILDNRTRLNKHLRRIYNVERLTERLSRVVHYIKLFENADWKIEGVVPRKKLRDVGFISYQDTLDNRKIQRTIDIADTMGNGFDELNVEENPCAV